MGGYLVTTTCSECEGTGEIDGLCGSNYCLGGDDAFGGPCPRCGGTGGEKRECAACAGLGEIETECGDDELDPAAETERAAAHGS